MGTRKLMTTGWMRGEMMKVIEIIMSILEATVDMMERLSEENLVKVQYVTRQQANARRYRDAQEDVNDIRSKYDILPCGF